MTDRDEPAITIRMGLSRNPLVWVIPLLRGLAHVGLIGTVFVIGTQVDDACCAVILPLLILVPLFVCFLRDTFRVDCTSILFFDDRVEVELRHPERKARRCTQGYRDIGHIELLSLSEFEITFVDAGGTPYPVRVLTRAGQAEDLFDTVLDQIRSAEPDHLFSISESGAVRFSVDCRIESLFPDLHDPVDRVVVDNPTLTAGKREFDIHWPELRFEGQPILRLTTDRVLTEKGTVLTSCKVAAYREITIEVFTDQIFHVSHDLELALDGDVIGCIVEQPGRYAVELDRPQPLIIAVMIVLAFISNRNALRV